MEIFYRYLSDNNSNNSKETVVYHKDKCYSLETFTKRVTFLKYH